MTRPHSPYLDSILEREFPCLDYGFVRVIDYMGDDAAVVQAARVSYGAGTRKVSDDRGLLRYLLSHRHTSPFEMCELKLHVKLPIFVARQWIRHRMSSVNEYSARYSVLDREFYLPRPEDLAVQSRDNKQGRGETLPPDVAANTITRMKAASEGAYELYGGLMVDHNVARELARTTLPVNFYTEWYWKIDLHNLLHFLQLRLDRHAQYEIRVYAETIAGIVKQWCPLTWEAFEDYRLNAYSLSAPALAVVQRMLAGEAVVQEGSGLSRREWDELWRRMSIPAPNPS